MLALIADGFQSQVWLRFTIFFFVCFSSVADRDLFVSLAAVLHPVSFLAKIDIMRASSSFPSGPFTTFCSVHSSNRIQFYSPPLICPRSVHSNKIPFYSLTLICPRSVHSLNKIQLLLSTLHMPFAPYTPTKFCFTLHP